MRHTRRPLVRPPQESLAGWVSTLSAGSPCFCCGSPLETAVSDNLCCSADAPGLVCVACGARVADDASVVMAAAFVPRTPALAA